eukprot:gnl/TRDRNA2_/TRDRNA2_130605_c0_seq1.p1 gnl/TRDRNA2_/TRDRNA2_130605_c0~~gnl/TRDRNA2_/TRDRNA2_130605_c0_seq1.p1  ORF type:complete len:311 (+),score=53.91 gnl/TRDRNA2_/TRDRNA2_130605_c0_seq1:51-983(+)
MAALREIALRRAKISAKIHPMDQGGPVPQQPAIAEVTLPAGLRHGSCQTEEEPVRSEPRRYEPMVRGTAGPHKASESRKPRSSSEPPVGQVPPQSGGPRRYSAGVGRAPTPPPAKGAAAPRTSAPSSANVYKKDGGNVPVYIRRRQAELAEAQRLANLTPEPEPPPGYRKVARHEQLCTVSTLKKRIAEVEKEQRALPLKIETVGQRRREKELTNRVADLGRLLEMFTKPIVFVPADSEPIVAVDVEETAPPANRGPRRESKDYVGSRHCGREPDCTLHPSEVAARKRYVPQVGVSWNQPVQVVSVGRAR